MNKLPNEIINQILLFNSHPVADLLRPIITTTERYQTLSINGKIKCIDNCEDIEISKQYEIDVIGNSIRTRLNVKSFKQPFLYRLARLDPLYFDINRVEIKEILIQDSCKRHGVANMDEADGDWILYV